MIILRDLSNSERLTTGECQKICTFNTLYRYSGENHVYSLKSCGFFLDFFDIIHSMTHFNYELRDLRNFLIDSPWIDFDENDRLSYIDNDSDEVPIDQQSEYLEALKFAEDYCKGKDTWVPLIITKALKKSEKPLKTKKNTLSKTSSDKMRVESTPLRDLLTSDTPEGAAAVQEFQEFLESYKKEIVDEVTDRFFAKMTSAMLLSQNSDAVESPSRLLRKKHSKKSKKVIDGAAVQHKTQTSKFLGEKGGDILKSILSKPKLKNMTRNSKEECSQEPVKFFKKQEEDKAEPSVNIEDNLIANENQQFSSDSDNISILSDHSHMSDFLVDEVVQTKEPAELEGAHDSSSSFELVLEPSSMNANGKNFLLGKKSQKSMDSDATQKHSQPGPSFVIEPKEKSYVKNIAETSEDTCFNSPLEKRSGGAYSFVPHNSEVSRENIFEMSSPQSAKPVDENFKWSSAEKDPSVFSSEKEESTEQEKFPEQETPQPRRRVVFDHNTSKGLGDTQQTSPKKRASKKPEKSAPPFHHGPHATAFHDRFTRPYAQSQSVFCSPPVFSAERTGNHENWQYFYGGQVPPKMNQSQWPPAYPPYPDTMEILPEILISGAVQAASSAFTTARKVIEKIRSQPPDTPVGPRPPKL